MRAHRSSLEFLPVVALLLASPVSADSSWTIPGIVNAGGLNNTRFVSDVTLTNPGTAALQVTVAFIPTSTSNTKDVTLNAGETRVYRNVVDSLFGTSGAGALQISSPQPLLLRARTYNTAAGGTFGVALPVYADERLLAPGDRANSLWISQDASSSSGSRTNVAVVFPDETGGAATVTVYDADGNERGHRDYSLDTPGLQQFSVGSFAGAVAVGRAQVAVTRGRAAGYAVVVDNVTGDSSLFTFEDLPGGRQDVLVNGVARATGRNGAFFRTDGRFYNPTDTDATIHVAFHANQNANPSPVSASFVLPAGKIRDVVDVLDSLLSLPVGSAGALRFTSDWPVAILCRTSNVDPSGTRQGAFGSQQKPVPVLAFLTSADAGAAITGIRQDVAFRTNVGFAAGQDGASYTLALATAGGATVGTATASLGPFGWTQPGVQDLFPTVTVPADATLRVRVTGGSLDVFDSSIDNLSGDPVVTPIAALPAAIPSSATIGPQGGSIRSDDGRLTLRIPAGALTQPVSFSFQTTTNGAPQGIGPGYQLSPSGASFARPALLTLAYGRDDMQSASAEALTLATTSGSRWYAVGGGSVDPGRHTLTVPVTSTSPAASASAGPRVTLDLGPASWGTVRSWELLPTGKRTVLVGDRLTFRLYSVGGSSSTLGGGAALLSTSPFEVDVTWYVNGIEIGDAANGLMVKEGTTGIFFAPQCPPSRNPVEIYAILSNNTIPGIPYRAAGTSSVRVLAKKWKVRVDPDFTTLCASGADLLSYHVSFEEPEVLLTLDNTFLSELETVAFTPQDDSRTACPCPAGFTPSLVGTATLHALVVRVRAAWDEEKDSMHVAGLAVYEGISSLKRRCTAAVTGGYSDDEIGSESGFDFSFDFFGAPGVQRVGAVAGLPPGQLLVVTRTLTPVCP